MFESFSNSRLVCFTLSVFARDTVIERSSSIKPLMLIA